MACIKWTWAAQKLKGAHITVPRVFSSLWAEEAQLYACEIYPKSENLFAEYI